MSETLSKKGDYSMSKLMDDIEMGTWLNIAVYERLDFACNPSDSTDSRICRGPYADQEELLFFAHKVPEPIHRRIEERPDAFRKFAALDDQTMNLVLEGARNSKP